MKAPIIETEEWFYCPQPQSHLITEARVDCAWRGQNLTYFTESDGSLLWRAEPMEANG